MPTIAALDSSVRELVSLTEEFVRCLRQRDAERLAASYYASDSIIHVPGAASREGLDEVKSFWLEMFQSGLIDCRREATRIETEHELAWCAGRYCMTMETQPGILQVERGKYLSVYRRQPDGCWRVVAESLSRNES
jgi:ketosteroid isomerase-like protein